MIFVVFPTNLQHWETQNGRITMEKTEQQNVGQISPKYTSSWWRYQMETFSALLALCARNSPATGEFTAQRPVTRSFDVFYELCLNKRLSKQSGYWWFETPSDPLWRHSNDLVLISSYGVLLITIWLIQCALDISRSFLFEELPKDTS